jgi:hypothetical protein
VFLKTIILPREKISEQINKSSFFFEVKTRKRVFLCTKTSGHGFSEAKSLIRNVFPEYEFEILQGAIIPNENFIRNFSSINDIFIDTFQFRSCSYEWMSWLFTHFNGHLILFSGESERKNPFNHFSQRKDHFHSFGPLLEPSRNDHVITYMQYTWIDRFYKILTPDILLNGFVDNYFASRSKFVVYANSNCVKFRERAVSQLSKIGKVYCSGKCQGEKTGLNSSENLINIRKEYKIHFGNWWKNIELFKEFQFCLVMEHEKDHKTYITEKILLAFSAGCIPIYYGPDMIFDIFNKKSFVFYNISNPMPALIQIRELLANETKMKEMRSQKNYCSRKLYP